MSLVSKYSLSSNYVPSIILDIMWGEWESRDEKIDFLCESQVPITLEMHKHVINI